MQVSGVALPLILAAQVCAFQTDFCGWILRDFGMAFASAKESERNQKAQKLSALETQHCHKTLSKSVKKLVEKDARATVALNHT